MTGSSEDEAAFQLDLYLDQMLAQGPSRLVDGPRPDPAVTTVAAALAGGATRFHPSFRFEERLARRLREAATQPVSAPGVLVPFGPVTAAQRPRAVRRVGGVIVGSAIASGVSLASLAGAAALVVWRRARWERLV